MQIKTPNTKFITNINWDKDINGLRKVELDDFKSLNSNVNKISSVQSYIGSPIDGTTTRSDISLFLVRKRLLKLMDLWNRILNSGLFSVAKVPNSANYETIKIIGSNMPNVCPEYLIKDWVSSAPDVSTINMETSKVFYRLLRFINAAATAYYYYIINGYLTNSFFDIATSVGLTFYSYINKAFNPTSEKFVSLMDELLDVIKSLLDETKLSAELNLTFNDLYFSTEQGRINITNVLYNYHSKYNLIAKIDSSYLETNLVPQDKTLLYPQFGSVMSRNTESETWNVRNVIVDTSTYNTENNPDLNIYRKPSKIVCSQLKMDRPIKVNTQYINWNDSDDEPYVMVYNGGTFIHIPDEIKIQPDTITKYIEIGELVDFTGLSTEELNKLKIRTIALESSKIITGFELLINETTDDNIRSLKKIFGYKGYPESSDWCLYIKDIGTVGAEDNTSELYLQFMPINIKIGTKPKNSSFKVRVQNENSVCNVYLDDILVYTYSGIIDFARSDWAFGTNSSTYQSVGQTLSDVKFIYINDNNSELQPDNQLNIAAKFWKIGAQDTTDPKYNTQDDIKLKLDHPLNELTKFDYFDNLTLYMKLD